MSDRRKKKVQSHAEQTYRMLKAFNMYPEMLEQTANKLFNVLDVTKCGVFKRDDLILFVKFMVEEVGLTGIGTLRDDEIDDMLRKQGIHDLKKINKDEL